MKLHNRFAELVSERERRTGRRWRYEDISQATGLAMSTLSAYAQNKVGRFDAATVVTLITFFGCSVSDFFVIENEESEQGQLVAVATA